MRTRKNFMEKSFEICTATKKEIDEIDIKLGEFNQEMLSFSGKQEQPLSFVVKEKNNVIGGIVGSVDWGFVLYVDLLFVDKNHRHRGIGSSLLRKIEHEAKNLGAGLAVTDTFDFQGKDFYLKNGY